MIDILFPKLHKEGYRFLAAAAVITFPLEEKGVDENGAPEKLICLLLYVVGC